ncbi:MAG TPA: hypothetical protein V6D23_04675, partial [Candidatus Obscuribacterales bacterium]
AVDQDLKEVSGEFTVRFPGPGKHLIAVPIDKANLPADVTPDHFLLEREVGGSWQPTGFLMDYDAAESKLYYDVDAEQGFQTNQTTSARFRVRTYLFTTLETATRPGSPFRIHYYPVGFLNYSSRVMADNSWNNSGGHASDPGVPDFVEDLDAALNEVYPRILLLERGAGQPMFKRPEEPIDVYVLDTGEANGESKMGGNVRISNTRVKNYQTMKITAGHELVHSLQGQYYRLRGILSGKRNRAFIEAMADYYAAEASGLLPAERKAHYGENSTDYLSLPIWSSSESSMYSAGHFLEWLEDRYGKGLIAETLERHKAYDFTALDQEITERDSSASLGSAFVAYGKQLMSHPEMTGGFGLHQKSKVSAYAEQQGHLSQKFLRGFTPYSHLSLSMKPMSMSMASLNGQATEPMMLVVHAQPSRVDSQTFFVNGSKDADYSEGAADEFTHLFEGEDLVVENFGSSGNPAAVEQLLINRSLSSTAVDVDYYLLQAQNVTGIEDGKVSWSTALVAQIPTRLIKGFRVYVNGDLLEGSELVPYTGSGAQSFGSPLIRPDHEVQVSVVDQAGHAWPPRPSGEGVSEIQVWLDYCSGCTLMEYGKTFDVTATVEGTKNTGVDWEVISELPDKPVRGTLTINENKVTYHAPAAEATECIIARAKAKPSVSKTVCVGVTSFISNECVTADTPVTLSTGAKKPIAELQPGDKVLAWDSTRGEVQAASVDKVLRHAEKPYDVELLRTFGGQSLTLTDDHPVATPQGWKQVHQLAAGDIIYTIDPVT